MNSYSLEIVYMMIPYLIFVILMIMYFIYKNILRDIIRRKKMVMYDPRELFHTGLPNIF